MKPVNWILAALALLLVVAQADAESRTVLIQVKLGKEKKASVTIHSDEKKEQQAALVVDEAVKIIGAMRGGGSQVGVYFVSDRGIASADLKKLFAAITDNPWLQIEYFGREVPMAVGQYFLKRSQVGRKTAYVERNGLGLSVALDKKSYGPADEVVLRFVLKNQTDKVLFIGDGFLAPRYHEAGPGKHFEAHVNAGGKHRLFFYSGMMTEGDTAGIRKVFKLKPREEYKGSIRLSAGTDKDREYAKLPHGQRGGSFEDKSSHKPHVLGKDGERYTVELRYQVQPESYGAWQPPADFKDELLWKGALTSVPLEFEVSSREGIKPGLSAQAPLSLSLLQLIATPHAFDGKYVRVQGFVRIEHEGTAIYLHREDAEQMLTKNGLWLAANDVAAKDSIEARVKDRYALVEGRFTATRKGHMGLWSGTIEEITRMQPWQIRKSGK